MAKNSLQYHNWSGNQCMRLKFYFSCSTTLSIHRCKQHASLFKNAFLHQVTTFSGHLKPFLARRNDILPATHNYNSYCTVPSAIITKYFPESCPHSLPPGSSCGKEGSLRFAANEETERNTSISFVFFFLIIIIS